MPGPAPHCNPNNSHYGYATHPTWMHILTHFGPIYGKFDTCGDLLFSGHTAVVTLNLLLIRKHFPQSRQSRHSCKWRLLIPVYLFVCGVGIISSRKHYTVDVVLGIMIATLVFSRFEHGWRRRVYVGQGHSPNPSPAPSPTNTTHAHSHHSHAHPHGHSNTHSHGPTHYDINQTEIPTPLTQISISSNQKFPSSSNSMVMNTMSMERLEAPLHRLVPSASSPSLSSLASLHIPTRDDGVAVPMHDRSQTPQPTPIGRTASNLQVRWQQMADSLKHQWEIFDADDHQLAHHDYSVSYNGMVNGVGMTTGLAIYKRSASAPASAPISGGSTSSTSSTSTSSTIFDIDSGSVNPYSQLQAFGNCNSNGSSPSTSMAPYGASSQSAQASPSVENDYMYTGDYTPTDAPRDHMYSVYANNLSSSLACSGRDASNTLSTFNTASYFASNDKNL